MGFLILGLFNPLNALAQINVPSGTPTQAPGTQVNVGVADTILALTGCASPNAFVQIFNGNTPVGTTTANSQGRFSKRISINNSSAGLHTFKFYFEDVNNRTSSVVSRNINLSSQSDTALDLLLPTTIEHEPEPVVAGNYLIFRGSTCPKALVNVNLDNNFTLAANADSKGNWYVIANTDNFYKGGHVYDALSSLNAQLSPKTQKYQFNVTGDGQAPGEPPAELTAPVITEPADLFLSSSDTVTLRGNGPLNAQIELFVDGLLTGSVFTNPLGQWSFTMKLNGPLSTVTARSCYQNKCGDFGNSVRIRFGGDISLCSVKFRLEDYRFFGIDANGGIDLNLTELEGKDSYAAIIDWGDATLENFTLVPDDILKFHHVYSSHGQYNGSMTLSNPNGCQTSAFFSVLVSPGNPPNWWMLGIIPLAGGMIYLLSSFVSAYQNQRAWVPSQSEPQDRPQGWPSSRPWLKPAYGADKTADKGSSPKKKPPS
jgi:hypothetical protein